MVLCTCDCPSRLVISDTYRVGHACLSDFCTRSGIFLPTRSTHVRSTRASDLARLPCRPNQVPCRAINYAHERENGQI